MARKLVLAALLAVCVAGAAFAEIELGFGIAPPLASSDENVYYDGFFYNNTAILHAGYSFAWLFYASVDMMMMPPSAVSGITGYLDPETGLYTNGIFRPGVLSMIDIGIRPRIGGLMLMVSTGINNLYVYKQDEISDYYTPSLGVNLRAGVGLKLGKHLGLMVSATTVFSDFDTMIATLQALDADGETAQMAQEQILNNLFPAAVISLHL